MKQRINYRKIYEKHYGPIPKDSDGRSYEIHHIDGDHSNDIPENMKAVTIQEHYDIHESQGDWYACLRIAERMKRSPEEISELATKFNLKRVDDGIHPFQTRSDGTNLQTDRVENRTHNLLKRPDGSSQSSDRIKNGTHHTLTEEWREITKKSAQKRVNDRTHHLLGPESNRKRLENGNHNFLKENK